MPIIQWREAHFFK